MNPDKNTIPPVTHPYGKYWKQPPLDGILIDDTHALMSERDFASLAEYSATNPTGAYEGKMWRRHDGKFDRHCKPEDCRWLLCWFGFSDKPDMVSNNYRQILLA